MYAISFFPRGGKILTEFLGGGQNMKKNYVVGKNTKSLYFFNSRGAFAPPAPPNDVPVSRLRSRPNIPAG